MTTIPPSIAAGLLALPEVRDWLRERRAHDPDAAQADLALRTAATRWARASQLGHAVAPEPRTLDDRLVSTAQAARALHVDRRTVLRMIDRAELPATCVGRGYLVPWPAVMALLERRDEDSMRRGHGPQGMSARDVCSSVGGVQGDGAELDRGAPSPTQTTKDERTG